MLPGSSDLPEGLTHRAGTSPPILARAPIKPALRPEWAGFLPIWSCSVWGLPCPRHYCRGGALLPHLFTLTSPILEIPLVRRALRKYEHPLIPAGSPEWARRYVFCGTFRPPCLNPASRTLSGTLLCGVRTFLPAHSRKRFNISCANGRGGRPIRLPTYSLYAD